MSAGTGSLIIDADSDDNGSGDFAMTGSADLITANTISITANDLSLGGGIGINSGAATTSILKSNGGTIGVGDGAGDMTIANNRLDNITAGALIIGGANTGNIVVDNVTGGAGLANIAGAVTFTAGAAGSTVTFNGTNSNFSDGLNVNATDGILIDNDLVTNGITTLDADSDDDGTGDTTINALGSINTTGNDLTIRNNDLVPLGTINSGAGDTTILVSNGGTISLGSLGGDLDLLDTSIDLITANSITFGDATAGAITIGGDVSPANTSILHLHTGSTITGTAGGIIEDSLALTAGGLVDFTDASTDVDNLAVSAAGQTVNFTDTDDVDIDTVAGVVGVTAGTFDLNAGGAVTDAQAIAATNLAVTTTGAVTLDTAANDVDNLAVSAAGQTVSFTDADDVDIDTVSGVTGVTATTFNLNTSGTVSDSVASTISGTTAIAAGAGNNITLDTATNNFGTVGITSGNNVQIVDQNALTMVASTISGSLDVEARNGFSLNGDITTNGITSINTDSDDNGSGNYSSNGTSVVNTNGNDLSIIAKSLIFNGTSSVDSGAGVTRLFVTNGGTVDIGGGSGDYNLSDSEIDRVTASSLLLVMQRRVLLQ